MSWWADELARASRLTLELVTFVDHAAEEAESQKYYS
jgi:hypothetical protein